MTTTAMDRSGSETDPSPEARGRTPVRLLRKIGVAIAGTALIVAGAAMLVLPGPGIVAILAGLGLLGTEFPAARRVSTRLNAHARTGWRKIRRPRNP
ncbi:PGPGW domain-containing protein [Spirillospora sp. CA-142024]|uniref:PGPGW domain-containing protein n=1 Tax=Spirillospora sp. CA-142024 TaxID=3240036 RepID=UPI003D8F20CF